MTFLGDLTDVELKLMDIVARLSLLYTHAFGCYGLLSPDSMLYMPVINISVAPSLDPCLLISFHPFVPRH